MTRCFLLFIFSISLFLNSCKKDNNELFDYNIQGINDISSNIGEIKVIDLSIERTKGSQEEVILNLTNIPKGVTYVFDIDKGKSDYKTKLTLKITQNAVLGKYSLIIEAVSASTKKSFPFELLIDDQLSLLISVYDATKWNSELPWGLLTDSATINLYKSEADFLINKPAYSQKSNEEGKALFYRIINGNYLFVVEKGELSNIVEKKASEGKNYGFATAGIFKTKTEVYNSSQPHAQPGNLKYRDQNADGKITDDDRVPYDELSVYENVLNEKVTWIGK